MESDIVERLREATVPRLEMGWPAPHVVQRKEPLWIEAADEIERLRAELVSKADELAAAIKERDEARRDACAFEAISDFNKKYPTGCMTSELAWRLARIISAERGWDCFAQQQGGGA